MILARKDAKGEIEKIFDRRAFARAVSIMILAIALAPSIKGYGEFRELKERCSNFFYNDVVLKINNRVCRRHIVLNSLYKDDAYLLKPVKQ